MLRRIHTFIFILSLISVLSVGSLFIVDNIDFARSAGPSFGGIILTVNAGCTQSSLGICTGDQGVCALCQSSCGGVTEITFAPAAGSELYYLCVPEPFAYDGGYPQEGYYILGEGTSIAPIQIGIGTP